MRKARIVRRMTPILNDPETSIIIELIGGRKAAKELVLNSLQSDKNVITANKLLLADSWEEIFAASRQGQGRIFFEAAVAGAIPQKHLGLTARLLGIFETHAASSGQRTAEGSVRVHPCLLPTKHPFATVHDEYNAIWLETDAAGDLYFLRKGAGSLPAASAVLSDLKDLFRLILSRAPIRTGAQNQAFRMRHMREMRHACYLRLWAEDKPGVLAWITGTLGRNAVSIAQIYQGESTGFKKKNARMPVIIVTHPAAENRIQKALQNLRKSPQTKIAAFLRILP